MGWRPWRRRLRGWRSKFRKKAAAEGVKIKAKEEVAEEDETAEEKQERVGEGKALANVKVTESVQGFSEIKDTGFILSERDGHPTPPLRPRHSLGPPSPWA